MVFPHLCVGFLFLILYPAPAPPPPPTLSSHTLFHTTLSHTIFHTQLCHTLSFTHKYSAHTHNFVTHHPSFTPGDIYRRLAWQAWHLATSTFVSRGRRGTYGTGLALVARLGPLGRAVTPRHFGWQAWRLRA